MASIKVKFRPSSIVGREGSVYYQIIHERKIRQLISDYKVYPAEWSEKRSMVITGSSTGRRPILLSVYERIRSDIERFNRIIRRFDHNGLTYTADDIVDEFSRYVKDYTLFRYMEDIIARMRANGKVRTSETYTAALRSFKTFVSELEQQRVLNRWADVMLDSIDTEIIESYEAWLKNRGVATNTISFYTRILRAVYNRAVDHGIIENRNPFRHVYTGVDKTVKRALPVKILKKIRWLDLSASPALDYARDMFMLSFMLRGMSLVDMAFLRKTDLVNNHITYRRRKTGQQLIIKWTKEMQEILDKYPENTSDYLLPLIKRPGTNERCTYRNTGYTINRNLKQIAAMVGINVPITLYVARHSWASVAKSKGIPVSVISEGMGHDSEATTQIYLASLDTSVVDRANALIIKSIQKSSASRSLL